GGTSPPRKLTPKTGFDFQTPSFVTPVAASRKDRRWESATCFKKQGRGGLGAHNARPPGNGPPPPGNAPPAPPPNPGASLVPITGCWPGSPSTGERPDAASICELPRLTPGSRTTNQDNRSHLLHGPLFWRMPERSPATMVSGASPGGGDATSPHPAQ